jgi:calcineurin-like phosphoesterase family protein
MRIATVHGCYEELSTLLGQLGYEIENGPDGPTATPPDGRKAVFVGDLVDRGPKIPDVLRLVMRMVAEGEALCVPGNHDMKLMRKPKRTRCTDDARSRRLSSAAGQRKP